MNIDFFNPECQTFSNRGKFGICDDPPPDSNPAYIDEQDGTKWIAVVENDNRYEVTFTAIDNCIEIRRADGKAAKRCDGALTYGSTIIFVELKQRGAIGNAWVTDGELQLRTAIDYFEREDEANNYTLKQAYIANSERPKFKESQMKRMDQFFIDTGYVLRIINRIKL
jgi:hypothetical protein